jgi:PAS domain S-box-containing protein
VSKTRILIVEDHTIVARGIAEQLALLGYEPVAQTALGEQALVLAEQLRPDLVLMDIQLAGELDGIRAAQAIREQFAIPVVFLTALEGDETLERAKAAEPFGYVVKPFQDRELRAVIEMALHKHRALAALRESEQRFRDLAELLPQTVYEADAEGRLTFLNRQTLEMTGYTRVEFEAGLSCFQMLAPHERDRARENVQRVLAGQDLGGIEYTAQRKDGTQFPVVIHSLPILRQDAPVGLRGIAVDLTEYKQAQEALRHSELRYRRLFEAARDGILILDAENGMILDVNPFLVEVLGYSRDQFLGKRIWELGFFEDLAASQADFAELQRQGYIRYENLPLETADGRRIEVEFVSNVYLVDRRKVIQCNIRDITERRIAESEREIVTEILRLISQKDDRHELMRAVTALLQDWSGCEAVGVRLHEGDDFPYFETRGFPPEFVLAENRLCAVDVQGELERDSDGNPILECMCGNVIAGRFDPALPFFTETGSFWTNSTTELLAGTTEADRQGRTRNRCNRQGYESVALVPLRAAGRTFGLLQFNDRPRGRFNLRTIQFLQRLADSLAVGLAQREAAEERRAGEEKLRAIFESAPDSIMLVDARTGEIIEFNDGACQMLGYTRKGFAELKLWDIAAEPNEETAARLDKMRTLGQASFETRARTKDGRLLDISVNARVLSLRGRQLVVAVASDITERKRAEKALQDSEERYRRLFEVESDAIMLADQDSRQIIDANQSAEALYGYSRAELLGLRVPDLSAEPEKTKDAITSHVKHVPLRWYRKKDGTVFPVEITAGFYQYQGREVAVASIRDITERRRAERQIADALSFSQKILETSPVGIITYKASGQCVSVNPAACRILGATAAQLLAQDFRRIDSWKGTGLLAAAEEVLTSRAKCSREIRGVSSFGKETWFEANFVPFDIEGEPHLFLLIADIKDRKQAEQALRESQERLRLALRAARIGWWHWDLKHNVLTTNDLAKDFFGLPATVEASLDVVWEFLLPEDRPMIERQMAESLTGPGDVRSEFRIRKADGNIRWLSVRGHAVHQEGSPSYISGAVQDITRRKRSEEAIQESARRYRELFEQAGDYALLLEPSEREIPTILHASEATLQAHGYSREELVGKSLSLVEPDLTPAVNAERNRLVATGKPVLFTVRHRRKDGSWFDAEVRVQRILFGTETVLLSVERDITERRRAEESLRRSEKIQAEAEKLAATGRLAARIAHEINNPLAGIKNAFHLVRDAVPTDHPDRDMVERIDREIARLSHIVQQMYTLHSPKSQQVTPVAVGDTIRDVLSMLDPLGRQHEVQFDSTCVLPGLIALAPQGGLHQILYNLTTNAVNASPPGSVVGIAAEVDESRPGFIRISVHDQGHGIPAEVQPRIFDPLFTFSEDDVKTDNLSAGGLGLGLSVVKGIVEAAGGRIDFESIRGEGTTFRVYLPNHLKALEA